MEKKVTRKALYVEFLRPDEHSIWINIDKIECFAELDNSGHTVIGLDSGGEITVTDDIVHVIARLKAAVEREDG